MNIRRFAQVKEENGFVASYTHMGGKIGVLVDVETDVVNDAVKEMAKNVAMQIAALKPQYTSDSEVSADYLAHEREILMAQIMNDPKESQKPEEGYQRNDRRTYQERAEETATRLTLKQRMENSPLLNT